METKDISENSKIIVQLLQSAKSVVPSLSLERMDRFVPGSSDREFVIAITGAMKSGKSTFINALLGSDIMPNENQACTLTTTDILHAAHDQRVLKVFGPDDSEILEGENLSKIFLEDVRKSRLDPANRGFTYQVKHPIKAVEDLPTKSRSFVLIDTPGINEMESAGVSKERIVGVFDQALNRANYLIYVLDFQYYKSSENVEILERIRMVRPDLARSIIFVMNKIDKLSAKDGEVLEAVNQVKRSLEAWGFKDNPIFHISAKLALYGRLIQYDRLLPIHQGEVKELLPTVEANIAGRRVNIQLTPEEASPMLLANSRITDLEDQILKSLYQHQEMEWGAQMRGELASTVEEYVAEMQQELGLLEKSRQVTEGKLSQAYLEQDLTQKIQYACRTVRKEIAFVLEHAKSQKTVFMQKKYNHPSISAPGSTFSGYNYGYSNEAKSSGLAILDDWFSELVEQRTMQIYSYYKDELVFRETSDNFFYKLLDTIRGKLKGLNVVLSRVAEQAPVALKLQPLNELISVMPELLNNYDQAKIDISPVVYKDAVQVNSESKSFLIFFTDTKYSFDISRAVTMTREKLQQALNTYVKKLQTEISEKKYEKFLQQVEKAVEKQLSPLEKDLERLKEDQQALVTRLEGELSDDEKRGQDISKWIERIKHRTYLSAPIHRVQVVPGPLEQIIHLASPHSSIELEAGVYTISERILLQNSMVLRGAGKDQTCIRFEHMGSIETQGSTCFSLENICVEHADNHPAVVSGGIYFSLEQCDFQGARNGEGIGAAVSAATEGYIESCSFERLACGLEISSNSSFVISGCTFKENSLSGVRILETSRVQISDSNFEANSTGALYLGQSAGEIINSCFLSHTIAGVSLDENAEPLLKGNIFSENDIGIRIGGSSKPQIEGNECRKNREAGIIYEINASGTAYSNICSHNEAGIVLRGASSPILEDNECSENQLGIVYSGESTGACRRNRLTKHTANGIEVQDRAQPSLVSNICTDNETGIMVSGPGGILQSNHCDHNRYGGIRIMGTYSADIILNVCEGNLYGIEVTDQAEPNILSNQYLNNIESGLSFTGEASGTASNNVCQGNDVGISLTGNASPLLTTNDCFANRVGIVIDDQSKGKVNHNVIKDSQEAGIAVLSQSSPTVEGNECVQNRYGLLASGKSNASLLENICSENREAGMYLLGQTEAICIKNVCTDNPVGILAGEHARPHFKENHCKTNKIGMLFQDHSGGTIKNNNCNHNEDVGIQTTGKAQPSIIANQCTHNKIGIAALEDSAPVVKRNQLSSNEMVGIQVTHRAAGFVKSNKIEKHAVGILLSGLCTAEVQQNHCTMNRTGIRSEDGNSSAISHNHVYNNDVEGIQIVGGAKPVLEHNQSNENQFGIWIGEEAVPTIFQNKLQRNSVGVYIGGHADAILTENDIMENDQGITFDDASKGTVQANKSTYNHQVGLLLSEQSCTALRDNEFSHNTTGVIVQGKAISVFQRNKVSANQEDGLHVSGDAVIDIMDNHFIANIRHGIFLSGSASGQLKSNEYRENQHYGIYIEGSTAFIQRRNKLRKNGVGLLQGAYWSSKWSLTRSHHKAKKLRKQQKRGRIA